MTRRRNTYTDPATIPPRHRAAECGTAEGAGFVAALTLLAVLLAGAAIAAMAGITV